MTPAYEKTLEVTPGGPPLGGKPTAEIHLLPWTYKHVLAWVICKHAGGRIVLDKETLNELARFRVKDEFVSPAEFVLTATEFRGPM